MLNGMIYELEEI